MASLDAIAALPEQKTKIEKYTEALTAALAADSADSCKAFVEHSARPGGAQRDLEEARCGSPCLLAHADADAARARRLAVLSDRNPLVISRQMLGMFAAEIGKLSPDVHKARRGRTSACDASRTLRECGKRCAHARGCASRPRRAALQC
jgi:hypothetical protein